MSDKIVVNKEPKILVFGILLITLGLVLLLDRLDVVFVRWNSLAWVVGVCFGGFFAVDGFIRKRRARIYWGSVLFFFSLYWALAGFGIIDHDRFYVTPVVLLSFGLSFFALYASDMNEYGLLIPALLLSGVGAIMILWWWEYLEWYEVRYALRTYWPLIFVAWGAVLLLQKRKLPAGSTSEGKSSKS